MITLVDGIPGAGKSYYAVHYMFANTSKYYKIFNNIDSFKYYDNIQELKFSKFIENIAHCKDIYDNESKSDKDIWTYLMSVDLLNSDEKEFITPVLIVLDEAHNYFDIKTDLYVWFLTYHRHLFIDIILVTQDSNLLHFAYRKLFQNILHAVPGDKQLTIKKVIQILTPGKKESLGGRLKYQRHIKLPLADGKYGTHFGDIFLDAKKEVFALYNSGDNVRSPYAFSKYIYFGAALLFSGLAAIYLLFNSFFSVEKVSYESVNNLAPVSTVISSPKHINSDFTEVSYIKLDCIVDNCFNNERNINLNIGDLNVTLSQTKSKVLSFRQDGESLAIITILATKDFKNLFHSGANNDDKKTLSILGD